MNTTRSGQIDADAAPPLTVTEDEEVRAGSKLLIAFSALAGGEPSSSSVQTDRRPSTIRKKSRRSSQNTVAGALVRRRRYACPLR